MDARLTLLVRLSAAASVVAGSLAVAQNAPAPAEAAQPPAPLPPPPEIGPAVEAPPQIIKPKAARRPAERVVVEPAPPVLLRSPVAILQVLDKVTAETLRFEAPVGKRVRYKTLLVEVKACETRGYRDSEPRASAYLIVSSRTAPVQASQAPSTSELFHGWTFAATPSLRALEHPVYDLWLVACSAAAPAV